ncbi:hypothetical protein TNCV_792611 [Trichonephila clavipes]|nr:hypothetical protein TNCV_792611 [Trichonephila clavipes]
MRYSKYSSNSKSSREVGGAGKALDHYQGILPQDWGGMEPKRTITFIVLKAAADDRRNLTLCRDEFYGPRSDTVDWVAKKQQKLNDIFLENLKV